MTDKPKQFCTFCAKDQDQVALLIAGPAVFICNECVELAHEIVAEQKFRDAVLKEVARLQAGPCVVPFAPVEGTS